MSSVSILRLGDFYLGEVKRDIDPSVMTLFRESDKAVKRVPIRSSEAAPYVDLEECDQIGITEITIVRYVCTAKVLCERLELFGITRDVARTAFSAARDSQLSWHQQAIEAKEQEESRLIVSDYHRGQADLYRSLTPEAWQRGLLEIRERGLARSYTRDLDTCELSPLLGYMLDSRHEFYGYPGHDIRCMLRLAAESLPEEEEFVYDLTDLILGGYFDSEAELVNYADYLLQEDFIATRRIVVLTEGSSDKWILEESLKVLHPHLADFFSFMDFEGARLSGGAGPLANIVKAFVGAGILNRIIAVFDNDTAGASALRTLQRIALPSNVRLLRLPRLPLAADYPTIGPTGIVRMDVNGLAASIELYLGEDVIRDPAGDLTPVQWRGFDEALGQYQGEILRKPDIHERFRKKLAAARIGRDEPPAGDWSGMAIAVDGLRSAFHGIDADDIVQSETDSWTR